MGAPSPQVWSEIENEHTKKDDSSRNFTTADGLKSKPNIEFEIVVNPRSDHGKEARKKNSNRCEPQHA